jgi:hypothetical protein
MNNRINMRCSSNSSSSSSEVKQQGTLAQEQQGNLAHDQHEVQQQGLLAQEQQEARHALPPQRLAHHGVSEI